MSIWHLDIRNSTAFLGLENITMHIDPFLNLAEFRMIIKLVVSCD